MDTHPLTATHRQAQLALRAGLIRELQRLWPAMDWDDVDRTFPAWAAAVSALVHTNHRRAAALAAAYLRSYRFSQGLTGEAPIRMAGRIPQAKVDTVLGVTAVASIKAATRRGLGRDQAMANAFVRSSGAVSRLVQNGARDTITASVDADPRAQGWQRATSANPCPFCEARRGRFMTSSQVFEAHDHCSCTAQPVYR